jgi:hypothetical protein
LLAKVFIGIYFYNKNTLSALRTYFIARYVYNTLIVCPLFAILHALTETFIPNFFLTGGLILMFEFILGMLYIRHLYRQNPIEIIDDIPGLRVSHLAVSEYRQKHE